MNYRIIIYCILVTFIISVTGCSSIPVYKPDADATVTLVGSDVRIETANHRVISFYGVDGMYLNKVTVADLHVRPGRREIGIYMIDRVGRLRGKVGFNLVANRRYHVEAQRRDDLHGSSLVGLAFFFQKKGFIQISNGQQVVADFIFKLRDESGGGKMVEQVPFSVTKDFESIPNEG